MNKCIRLEKQPKTAALSSRPTMRVLQQGMTLIEVMAAIIILSIVVTGFSSYAVQARALTLRAEQQKVATELADAAMEEVMGYDYATLETEMTNSGNTYYLKRLDNAANLVVSPTRKQQVILSSYTQRVEAVRYVDACPYYTTNVHDYIQFNVFISTQRGDTVEVEAHKGKY